MMFRPIAEAFGNQFAPGTEINFTNAAKNAKFQLRGFDQTVALEREFDFQTSLAIIQNDEINAPGYIGDPGPANLTIDTATNHVFTGLIRNQNGGALSLIKEGTGTQEIRNTRGADNFSSITVNNGIFRINFSTNANGTNVLVAGTSIPVNPGGTPALTGTTTSRAPFRAPAQLFVHGSDTVTPSGDNSAYFGTLTLSIPERSASAATPRVGHRPGHYQRRNYTRLRCRPRRHEPRDSQRELYGWSPDRSQ